MTRERITYEIFRVTSTMFSNPCFNLSWEEKARQSIGCVAGRTIAELVENFRGAGKSLETGDTITTIPLPSLIVGQPNVRYPVSEEHIRDFYKAYNR